MKRSSRLRGEANLFESIHQQLNMYAIAAGAAGVSVLALAQPSQAKIIYTKVNVQISGNQRYKLDLDNDGAADFTLIDFYSYCNVCHVAQGSLKEKPARSNAAIGYEHSNVSQASALSSGALIGQDQRFLGRKASMADWAQRCYQGGTCKSGGGGLWYNVTNRYLGVRFKIKSKIHYGWARLSVQGGHGITATLTGYAYETIPGKAIKAGQKKEAAGDSTNDDFGPDASLTNPISDKPQPASLGVLALGAQGVVLWRREQETETVM